MNITFIDNNSSDSTRSIILRKKSIFEKKVGGFKYIPLIENLGFGPANNIGVFEAKSNYCLLLNIDTEIQKGALNVLMDQVASSGNEFAIWEMKQSPYEHPKLYNPLTHEVSWCSGAACMVKKDVFMAVGGFDKETFMYGEDVELSWKIRSANFKLMYVPKSIVVHHTRAHENDVKVFQFKKMNMIKANFALRAKYGSFFCFCRGFFLYFLFVLKNNNNSMGREMVASLFGDVIRLARIHLHTKKLTFKPTFYLWDYEISKKDEDFKCELPTVSDVMISIIIRTIGNLPLLTESLRSVLLQTYPNIEVIIVEDGSDKAKALNKEFPELNITYFSSPIQLGRSAAGNIGLGLATGQFINFLDEDDILLADHLEVLVNQLINHNERNIAYSLGLEAPLNSGEFNPQFEKRKKLFAQAFNRPFNRLLLFNFNYFPIQSVMFSRDVFQEMGGFDETLTYLEDWDLWLRYSTKYPFLYIPKTTSIYRVPYNIRDYSRRKVSLSEHHFAIQNKYQYVNIETTYNEVQDYLREMKNIKSIRGKILKLKKLIKDNGFDYFLRLLARSFFTLYYKKVRRVIK